jgi:hypothetical protein
LVPTYSVISNSNGYARKLLEDVGLGDIDFVLDSFEVGIEKPDPRILSNRSIGIVTQRDALRELAARALAHPKIMGRDGPTAR